MQPELGASIAALDHEGRTVLRHAGDTPADPLDSGCFPLIPYANRIAHGRFGWDGTTHRLPLNFADHPHSLHGIGWQRRWTVAQHDAGRVALTLDHDGGEGWPWRFRAVQAVTLSPGVATIELSVANCEAARVPAGLGLHPYFPCDAATRLKARAREAWLSDETLLPLEPVPASTFGEWAQGAAVQGDTLIDHAHDGWDGTARIEQADHVLTLRAQGASAFHLYRPPGMDFFCFEPVDHLPDAINRGGMKRLAPGETRTLTLALAID
ncbi:hypothetical protein BFL28_01335 [Sphingomonas turrisvirgatae]|uniref:Epimerase n=1 Tax=Sphingomonas turrisvirgatae TaxID=1888892 RepID=A0A1E3LYE0_9SPHN|nr:hypothetical protein BFL28_01335 [Sphingomonas turrisvirgatae]